MPQEEAFVAASDYLRWAIHRVAHYAVPASTSDEALANRWRLGHVVPDASAFMPSGRILAIGWDARPDGRGLQVRYSETAIAAALDGSAPRQLADLAYAIGSVAFWLAARTYSCEGAQLVAIELGGHVAILEQIPWTGVVPAVYRRRLNLGTP
jgi:hypothetical protein